MVAGSSKVTRDLVDQERTFSHSFSCDLYHPFIHVAALFDLLVNDLKVVVHDVIE